MAALPAKNSLEDILHSLKTKHRQSQRLLPVVDSTGHLIGVITRGEIRERLEQEGDALLAEKLEDIVRPQAVDAYPDEPLRVTVHRMAEKGVTRMPVVEPETRRLLGLISLDDLLKARTRHVEEERRREQVFQLKNYFGGGRRCDRTPPEVVTNADAR